MRVRPGNGPVHENTVREFTEELASAVGGVQSRRTAQVLLSLVWDRAPGWISAHADDNVPVAVRDRARTAAERCARGEPVEYATGFAAFRNLSLLVDERVLIPRPETEIVVEEALRACPHGTAVDVGTGSGAIALALATEGGYDRIIACDVSADALAVARANIERVGAAVPVELRCGSLLQPVRGERVDLVVSNPPYISKAEMAELPRSVRDWEPPLALLAGESGLDHTAAIAKSAADVLKEDGVLVLEIDSRRADETRATVAAVGAYREVTVRPDLAGRPRVLVARRQSDADMESRN